LFLPPGSFAASTSAQYSILQDSLGAGGGRATSSAYQLDDSLGETGGTIQSSNGRIVLSIGDLSIISPPNAVPVPRNLSFERLGGAGLKISISKLVQTAHDPDGDLLELISFDATTTAGASVRKDGGWLLYQPSPGNNSPDSFSFTISDNLGAMAGGTIFISVQDDENSPTQNLTGVVIHEDHVIVHFAGIPGIEYQVQFTTSLNNPQWQVLSAVTAGQNGRFELRDARSPDQMRFYRALFIPSEEGP
jgi:hypothetical protein